MLKVLLFCHGRESYRPNAYLIAYMFYKNVLYVIPICTFGFFSNFGATLIFNMWLYQLYDIVFTGLPVIWYAVFDWEYDKQKFLSDPSLYRAGIEDVFFSPSVFWRWFGYSVWQGILLCVIVVVTMNNSIEAQGQLGGLSLQGNFIFCAIVLVVNVKILINSFQ